MEVHAQPVPNGVAQPALFGMTGLYYFAAAVARNTPPWEVVPPLVLALATLCTAVYNGRANLARARQSR
jgi:hypothetical protein